MAETCPSTDAFKRGSRTVVGIVSGVGTTMLVRSQLSNIGAVEWVCALFCGSGMGVGSLLMTYVSVRPPLRGGSHVGSAACLKVEPYLERDTKGERVTGVVLSVGRPGSYHRPRSVPSLKAQISTMTSTDSRCPSSGRVNGSCERISSIRCDNACASSRTYGSRKRSRCLAVGKMWVFTEAVVLDPHPINGSGL